MLSVLNDIIYPEKKYQLRYLEVGDILCEQLGDYDYFLTILLSFRN
ncbi:MAG: hypothetical protein CI949_2198 [Halanaerobium sp.]|nr:MAG: hypothetical protein CI949_2198 [Halanaerobium sp.]